MSKLSKQQPTHQKKSRAARARNYYREMERPPEDGNPIDAAVKRLVPQKGVQKRIVRLQEQVQAKLGKDTQPFLDLETLRNDVGDEREEVYFNLGYEHGHTAASTRARKGLALSKETEELARDILERTVQAQLPPIETMLALLDTLWAVAVTERGLGSASTS